MSPGLYTAGQWQKLQDFPIGIQMYLDIEERPEEKHTRWPLPVIDGIITPINGLINGFAWGYNPTYTGYFAPFNWIRGAPCMGVVRKIVGHPT